MDNKEILLRLIAHYADGKQGVFAKMIGISPQNLSLWVNRGGFDKFAVLRKFPNISIAWLDTGEGDMFNEVESKTQKEEIAYLREVNKELVAQNNKLLDILSSKLKV